MIPAYHSWDRFGSKAEIDIAKELQRRNLHFLYQREVELWSYYITEDYGDCCTVKKIHADWHTPIPFGEKNKQYPLIGLRYLFIFLDGEEAHKGKQADQDIEADQFIKDQGSIGLRYPYRAPISDARCREIVDQIESVYRQTMKGDS
jgi:hypothetical protein